MAQQPAHNTAFDHLALALESKRRDQVHDDVVVIAGVERDVLAGGIDNSSDHIKRLVAIEWGNLYGDHIFDFSEAPPK